MMSNKAEKYSPLIKKGDLVQVLSGKEKGKTGKVIYVSPLRSLVKIEKLNMIRRGSKPTQKNPQGGWVEKEAALHLSKVLLFCLKCDRGVRVSVVRANSKKQRICKKCKEQL